MLDIGDGCFHIGRMKRLCLQKYGSHPLLVEQIIMVGVDAGDWVIVNMTDGRYLSDKKRKDAEKEIDVTIKKIFE